MDSATRARLLALVGIEARAYQSQSTGAGAGSEVPDEDTEALIAALGEFIGDDERSFNEALHPRNPKGSVGGGRFRSITDRIVAALSDWKHGNGPDDPLKDFNREQLLKAAKAHGHTFRRGASIEEIKAQILDDVRNDTKAEKAARPNLPGAPADHRRFTIQLGGKPAETGDAVLDNLRNDRLVADTYRRRVGGHTGIGKPLPLADLKKSLSGGTSMTPAQQRAALERLRGEPGVSISGGMIRIDHGVLERLEAREQDYFFGRRPAAKAETKGESVDVGIFGNPATGRLSLYRESDTGQRQGRAIKSFADMAALESWARQSGHTELADYAKAEHARTGGAPGHERVGVSVTPEQVAALKGGAPKPGTAESVAKNLEALAPAGGTPKYSGFDAADLADEIYQKQYTKQQILDRVSGLNAAELKKLATATGVQLPKDFEKTEAGPVIATPRKLTPDQLREHIASSIARDRHLLANDAPSAPPRPKAQKLTLASASDVLASLETDLRKSRTPEARKSAESIATWRERLSNGEIKPEMLDGLLQRLLFQARPDSGFQSMPGVSSQRGDRATADRIRTALLDLRGDKTPSVPAKAAKKAAPAPRVEPAGTVRAEGYVRFADVEVRVVADGKGGYVLQRRPRGADEWQDDPSGYVGNTPKDVTSRHPRAGWTTVRAPAKSAAPGKAAPDVNAIKDAYKAHARHEGDLVRIADLRKNMGGTKAEQDAALLKLAHTPGSGFHVLPNENQKTLTANDRSGALMVGGQAHHLVQFDAGSLGKADTEADPLAGLEGLTTVQKRAALRKRGLSKAEIDALAPLEKRPRKAARMLDLLGITRALGHDITPGHDQLHHYWTIGVGRHRWANSPTPWRTLLANLVEEVHDVPLETLKRWASRWFFEVKGYYAGSDLNRVAHGKPPRGHRVGPG